MFFPGFLALAVSAEPAPSACSARTAEPATIQRIMENPAGYSGRCVAVTALTHGFLLFSSVEGYYRAGPLMGGDPARDPADRERLGLDNDRIMRRLPQGGLHHVTAIGRVQICEQVRDMVSAREAPGTVSWVTGFCHVANGPYLWLHGLRSRGRSGAVRLAGEANRGRIGDLVPAPGSWPHRRFVEVQAGRWLRALQGGDRREFGRIHLEAEIGGRRATRLAFGRHRGFADIRRGRPQSIILVRREPPDREDDYSSTICFCRTGDCSHLWPIAEIDADNAETRPYVCTRFVPFMLFRRGVVPAFITERGRYGLPEARSTRQ